MLNRLILFSLIVSTAAAGATSTWPAASRDLVTAQNAHRRFLRNPYLLTMVDQLQLKAAGWNRAPAGSVVVRTLNDSRDFVTPDGATRGLDVRLWAAPDRPLAIYLPGIFQGSADEDTARVVVTLIAAGHQVVVIPNPLSLEYFANYPVAPPHALAREAAVVTRVIAEMQRRTGAPRVRLVAASYGAALGARAWESDQAAATPRLEDLTLLFPQEDLGRAITLLDGAIATPARVDPPRAAVGAAYASSLRKLVRRLRVRYAEDATHAFVARSYPAVVAAALTDARPDALRDLNLRAVIERFVAAPEVLNTYASAETRLAYWLDRAYAVRGNGNVRLVTARDDWTNAPGAWADLPAWLNDDDHLLMLNNAGHAGVVAEDWFRRVILEAMK